MLTELVPEFDNQITPNIAAINLNELRNSISERLKLELTRFEKNRDELFSKDRYGIQRKGHVPVEL